MMTMISMMRAALLLGYLSFAVCYEECDVRIDTSEISSRFDIGEEAIPTITKYEYTVELQ